MFCHSVSPRAKTNFALSDWSSSLIDRRPRAVARPCVKLRHLPRAAAGPRYAFLMSAYHKTVIIFGGKKGIKKKGKIELQLQAREANSLGCGTNAEADMERGEISSSPGGLYSAWNATSLALGYFCGFFKMF